MIQNVTKKDPSFSKTIEYVKANTVTFCKTRVKGNIGVYNGYVKQTAVKKADGILIKYTSKNSKTRSKVNFISIAGFIIYQLGTDYIYLDVICAKKGYGRELLQSMFDFAQSKSKSYIVLSALKHVIGFYKMQGFVHAFKKCYEDEDIRLFYRQNNNNNSLYQFLSLLMRKKLVSDTSCKTVEECNQSGYIMTKCI